LSTHNCTILAVPSALAIKTEDRVNFLDHIQLGQGLDNLAQGRFTSSVRDHNQTCAFLGAFLANGAQRNTLRSELRRNSGENTGALIYLHIEVVAGQSLAGVSDRQVCVGIILRCTAAVNNVAAGTNDIAHYCRCGWVSARTISVEHQGTRSLCFNKDRIIRLRDSSQWVFLRDQSGVYARINSFSSVLAG